MKPQHDDAYDNIMQNMHGIPMTEEAFERLINVESPYRYELIDGVVYDMTGSTPEHTTEKFARYKLCPTLEVYILVSQEEQQVEVYRRVTDWRQELYMADQTIHLDQHNMELSLDAIYEGVLL